MITIQKASNITLQGLIFNHAPRSLHRQRHAHRHLRQRSEVRHRLDHWHRPHDATSIVIEDCQFLYPSPQDNTDKLSIFIGAGIYASENCSGLRVLRNRFESPGGGQSTATSFRILLGLWMTPTAAQTAKQAKATATLAARLAVNLPRVTDLLDDVEITDNRFTGLTIAVFVMAELGMIRCTSNRVANCCGGFWFLDSDLGANVAFGQAALATEQQATGAKLSTPPPSGSSCNRLPRQRRQLQLRVLPTRRRDRRQRYRLRRDSHGPHRRLRHQGNRRLSPFLGAPSTPAATHR